MTYFKPLLLGSLSMAAAFAGAPASADPVNVVRPTMSTVRTMVPTTRPVLSTARPVITARPVVSTSRPTSVPAVTSPRQPALSALDAFNHRSVDPLPGGGGADYHHILVTPTSTNSGSVIMKVQPPAKG